MDSLRVYRSLLGNRNLTRLLLGEFISGIGDWLYIVAIFIVIYRESNDAALVGAFGAVRMIPYVIMSVPAGIVADKFDRRLVLLASDIFRGAMMVGMAILLAVDGPIVAIAGLAVAATIGSSFFYPAIGAYIPALVEDERQLGPANSAWASLGNVSFILGPAIGGIVVAAGSVDLAFIINALTFVVIGFILWGLPPSIAKHAEAPAADGDAAAGAAPGVAGPGAATTPKLAMVPLAGLTLTQLIGGFVGGAFQVITVVLAIKVLEAGEAANGYLNAAIGIGGLVGALAAGSLVMRRGLGGPLVIGAVISGVATVALGLAGAGQLAFALVAIMVSAAGLIVMDVVATTMFQRLVPDELRGRVLGVMMAVGTLVGAFGAFIMPVLVDSAGPFVAFAVTGVLLVVGSIAGLALIGHAADRIPSVHEALIERVSTLPLFTGVPRARLETATGRLVEVPVSAGDVVVRQGGAADRFYVIARGEFSVTQVQAIDDVGGGAGPARLLRKLGPDEVFGELGLLNNSPRSATVTADTDGLLLALDDEDFLELVGAGGPLRGRLSGLYGGPGR